MTSARESRIALNEARFREINERLARGLQTLPGGDARVEFVCECGLRSCDLHIELALDEYEAVRSGPRQFTVVPGHATPQVERVVSGNERYEVVEKLGEGATIAQDTDPRQCGPPSARKPEVPEDPGSR